MSGNEELCNFDHETALEPSHWAEFWAWEKAALKQDQRLLKYVLSVALAVPLIAGVVRQDPALVFAVLSGGILVLLAYLAATRSNDYFRHRISKTNPVVKFNSDGYRLGKSYRPWPFGLSLIGTVTITELPNLDVLEIRLAGRLTGYHSVRIPFNKQDKDIIQYYRGYVSKRL
jgi:hypothetical protein